MSEPATSDIADGPVFSDGKDAGAFRTIGEIAQAFGIRQHVLRYWEEQFPVLKPLKRAGGRRLYRPEDVRLIAEINRLLYVEGFTIRGARQALGGKATASAPTSPAPVAANSQPSPPETAADMVPANAMAAKLRLVRDGLSQALQQS